MNLFCRKFCPPTNQDKEQEANILVHPEWPQTYEAVSSGNQVRNYLIKTLNKFTDISYVNNIVLIKSMLRELKYKSM